MPRLLALVAAMLLLLAGSSAALAQDASPIASPTAGPCDAPALPPGTPTPQEPEGSPAASPVADDMAGMEMGTPEALEEAEAVAETAEEVASPEAPLAPPVPAGTPADQAAGDEAAAAVENLANCRNAGNAEATVALFSPNFLQSFFGTSNPYDVIADVAEGPPFTVRSLANAQTYADGRISIDAVHTGFTAFGPSQVNQTRMFFVRDGDYHLLDAADTLPVAGAETTVDVGMVDYAFVLSQTTVPTGGLVAFNITNDGDYPHEFVVVQLPEGVTVDQVLQDPSLEEQIAFYGVNFAGPGGNASFALEGLEAGTYTVVCFVDEPEGIPHVVRGMVAEFTVQ